MSTLGIQPPGGCHFPLKGWGEFARLLQPMIERDVMGESAGESISPPDLLRASFTSVARDQIVLEFDQPVVWRDKLIREFYLNDEPGHVVSGSGAGKVITLKLKEPSSGANITYLRERDWSQERILRGANGIAALTFCEVSVEENESGR